MTIARMTVGTDSTDDGLVVSMAVGFATTGVENEKGAGMELHP